MGSRPRVLPVLTALVALASTAPAATPADPADAEEWATGLDAPVDLAFDAWGRLWYASLNSGNLTIIDPNGTAHAPYAVVPASPGGNGGFTGIAPDPDEEGVVYAFYSMTREDAPNGKVNRVVRVTQDDQTVLLDDLRWKELHEGGRLAVGPDGYLYVTTGDTEWSHLASDPSSLQGKVLRMTRQGEPAPGNPPGWNPYAWAMGFRNPFGIAILPDGRVFVSDNGSNRMEEVNEVQEGAHHGWPDCVGPCHLDNATDPIMAWEKPFGPTGVAVHDATLYVGDFVHGQVRSVDLATGADGVLWSGAPGGVLDVAVGPDECLYVSGWHSVWRIPLGGHACGIPDVPAPGAGATDYAPPDEDGPDAAPVPAPGAWLVAAAAATAALTRSRGCSGTSRRCASGPPRPQAPSR